MKRFLGHFPFPVGKWDEKEVCFMEYICMICGRKKHVLREGKVMLCTRCITALGLALGDKLRETVAPSAKPCHPNLVEGSQGEYPVRSFDSAARRSG